MDANFHLEDELAGTERRKRRTQLAVAALIAGTFLTSGWVMGWVQVDSITTYPDIFSLTMGMRNLPGGGQQAELITGYFNGSANAYALDRTDTLTGTSPLVDFHPVGGLINNACCAAPNTVRTLNGQTLFTGTAGNPPPGTEGTTDFYILVNDSGGLAGFDMFDESQGSTGSPRIFEANGTIHAILSDFSADDLLIYNGDPSTGFNQYAVIPDVDAPFGGAPIHYDAWSDRSGPNRGFVGGKSGSSIFIQSFDLTTGTAATRQPLLNVIDPVSGFYYLRGATNDNGVSLVGAPNPSLDRLDLFCVDGTTTTTTLPGISPDFWDLHSEGAFFGLNRPDPMGNGIQRAWVNCGDLSNAPVIFLDNQTGAPAPGYEDTPTVTATVVMTDTSRYIAADVYKPTNRQPDRAPGTNDYISISVVPAIGFFDTFESGNVDSWSQSTGG